MNPEQFLSCVGLWMIRANRPDGNPETMLPGHQERIIQKPLLHTPLDTPGRPRLELYS